MCNKSPGYAHAFLSPDYAIALNQAHVDCRVCVVNKGGAPVCFFPFEFADLRSRLFGWGDVPGAHLADYAGVVAVPGFRTTPRELLRASGLVYFQFTHLDESQSVAGLYGQKTEAGLTIDLRHGPDTYWADLLERDRDFVKDTERRQRQLESKLGTLRFSWNQPVRTETIDFIIDRKRDQYRRTGVRDVFAEEWTRKFISQLARITKDECAACTAELYAGETWVASHFGLRFRDRLHYWFPVYNPELQRYSPGRLLVKAIIDQSGILGIRVIDRGAGESKAKQDFANGRHQFHRGAWWRSGVRSLAIRAIQSHRWRTAQSTPGPSDL